MSSDHSSLWNIRPIYHICTFTTENTYHLLRITTNLWFLIRPGISKWMGDPCRLLVKEWIGVQRTTIPFQLIISSIEIEIVCRTFLDLLSKFRLGHWSAGHTKGLLTSTRELITEDSCTQFIKSLINRLGEKFCGFILIDDSFDNQQKGNSSCDQSVGVVGGRWRVIE